MSAMTDTNIQTPGRSARLNLELLNSQEFVILIMLFVLIVGVSLVNPSFFDLSNFYDILSNTAYIAVAAIGTTMVIISGNIDISMGAAIGVLATIAGNLAKSHMPVPLVFLITIFIGGLIGAVNGGLTAYARIPAIVVTLGMASILKGGLIIATQGAWIYSLPADFSIGRSKFLFDVPASIYVMLVLIVIAWFLMRFTTAGREIYAVGGNAEAARLAGLSPRNLTMRVFVLNGLLVGVSAVLYATKFNAIQSNVAPGFELTVITSAVIGGVSILGGTGSVIGALLGAVLLQVIGSALVFLKIRAEWFQAVQGGLILATMLIDILRRRGRR